MAEHLFRPWRKEWSTTKYPFADAATLVNSEGYLFPEGTFLDASLYPVGGGDNLRLAAVTIDRQSVTLTIGDDDNDALASVTFPLLSPPPVLLLNDVYGRPAGVFVSESNRLSVFQSWAVGVHTFTAAQANFVAAVCVPTPEIGLRGVVIPDGTLFVGDVYLVGEDGVVFREEESDVVGARVIRFDIVGDPLFRRRLCQPASLFNTPQFITQIRVQAPNGSFNCSPDEFGNLVVSGNNSLTADSALRVRTTADGLVFEVEGTPLS
jgi:hypothetical protein